MFLKKVIYKTLKNRKLITNISYYFFASLIGASIQLVLSPFQALYLEHEDFAITGYFTSFNSLLLPIITFSLISYYSRNFFLLDEKEREKLKNTLVIGMLFFSATISIISIMGLYWFFKINKVNLPFAPYAMLSVSNIFFNGFYTLILVELKMRRDAIGYFKISLVHSLIAALFAIFFVIIFKWGAFGKMLGTALVAFLFALYAFRVLLTHWEFDKTVFVKALKFSWPLTLAAMLNYFFSGIDRAMLEGLDDTKNLGLYNIAVQITGYLALFGTALGNTFQPDIFESIAKRNKTKTAKIIGGLISLNLIPIAIFIIFAPIIIKVLTFNRFTEAADFARVLSLKNITTLLYFSISTVIIGYGYTKITLLNKIVGTIISLLMFRFLIGSYGFYGAAWGQVFSFLLMSFIAFAFLLYKIKKL